MIFPLIAPPVSPAIAVPYPSTFTVEPSGITSGSTAITFLLRSFFKSIPVAVIPVHPSQSAVYAVASIVIVSPLLVSDDDSDSVVCSCSSTSTSTSTSSTCSSSCSGASCFGSSVSGFSDSDVSASGFSASVSSASGASSTLVSSSTDASLFKSDVSFSLDSSVSVDSFVSSCLGSSFTSLSFNSSDELDEFLDGCFSEPLTINVSPGTTMVSERLFHSIKSSNDTLCANAISLNVSPALTVYVSPELAVISLAGFC